MNNPYSVVLKHSTLPVSLFNENAERQKRPPLLNVESFEDTFGPKSRRKRPKLSGYDMSDYLTSVSSKQDDYDIEKDSNFVPEWHEGKKIREYVLEKG